MSPKELSESAQALQQQAKLLAGYKASLIAEGFRLEEALGVVVNYQTTMMQLNFMAGNQININGGQNE